MDIWKTKQIFSPEIIDDLRLKVDPPKFPQQQNMPGGGGYSQQSNYGQSDYNQGPAGNPNQISSMLSELQHNSGGKFRNVSPPRSNYMVC
jgi:hypothetical protein